MKIDGYCRLQSFSFSALQSLFSQQPGEDERGDDGGVAFDDETRRVHAEFAPGDFFVGHRAGVTAIARGRVADLAEITPERNIPTLQILLQHGYDADGEIAGNAAAQLK